MSIKRSFVALCSALAIGSSVLAVDAQPVFSQNFWDAAWEGFIRGASDELGRRALGSLMDGAQATPQEKREVLRSENPLQSYFPRATCGDALPTRASAYPVTIYPVQIRYTSSNLNVVQDRFCHDAFAGSEGRRIYVASFTSRERAAIFAHLMESQFGNAFIGEPEVIDERPF
ncbi:MAG: hypothetical protein EAY76_00230 [Alphaproteobacteria bacterium]|nr:MAG: hypothetical protein EAY76_00230 [Alphaproteobacteria bacterium]TAF75870.1 MAG: hypothetical protein EAZ52_05225 [Alphaproteobacteria bacterium]